MIAPWKSVVNMDNRTQIYTSELSCFSSDIQEVSVMYSENYRISKDDAQTIYRTIGAGYLQTVMDPKIQEAVKGVTAKYNAEKLVEQRGTLSAQIEEVLKESLTPYNIELVSTSLANIDFTDAFTNAVEAKQVAEQNKLRAQTEQEQAIIEANAAAERQVIQAQANADSAVLAAKADAEVQQIGADAAEYAGKKEAAILSNIGEQMTKYPGLEKYYYYQNWNGKLPQTVLGSGTEIIMDMPSVSAESVE
jgi:regulator of protease activity HflC (stomatin/prohibitin superfamily)